MPDDKRDRGDRQQSSNQPDRQRSRDRKSGGSMESPDNRRPPREREEDEPRE